MKAKLYRPHFNRADERDVLQAVAIVAAGGFLAISAPVAYLRDPMGEKFLGILLSTEERHHIRRMMNDADPRVCHTEPSYVFDGEGRLRKSHWDYGENQWVRVVPILEGIESRGQAVSNHEHNLKRLLEEAARCA